MNAFAHRLRRSGRIVFNLWPYFLGYAVGGSSAGYKFAGETGVVWTSLMLTAIVLMSLVFFFLAEFLADLRVLWRNRGLIPMDYTAEREGQVIFRAVLEVPREWRRLNPTEQARRVLAQVKGQYGLSVVSLPFSGGQRMKIRETNQRHISG